MLSTRNYEITIQDPQNNIIVITPPFSAKISVKRDILAAINKTSVTIYNLGKYTRNRIYKDKYTINEYWQMKIRAGYNDKLSTIFLGNIREASSVKDKTDWVTSIEAEDGLYAVQNGFISQTIEAGTEKVNLLDSIVNTMTNTIKGYTGSPTQGTTERGKVLFGQSYDVLQEETDGQAFIDNEEVNIISRDEADFSRVAVLDSRTLFKTPKRFDNIIQVSTLFYPEIKIAQICRVRSSEPVFNGDYKTIGIQHTLEVMSSTSGSAQTMLSLDIGANALRPL